MSLAVVAIVKDEIDGIREWIAFHQVVGVDEFLIYDNGSTDGTRELLDGLAGVKVLDWPGPSMQIAAYSHALANPGLLCSDWTAFIDADEFLWSPTLQPLPVVLEQFWRQPAIGACWVMYGTSGLQSQPELVLPWFRRRARLEDPVHRHVKSIVKRWTRAQALTPHHFAIPGVDEHLRPLQGPFATTPTWDLLRVNHYWSQSVEHATRKAQIRRADNGATRSLEQLLSDDFNAVIDNSIVPYCDLVCARMEQL